MMETTQQMAARDLNDLLHQVDPLEAVKPEQAQWIGRWFGQVVIGLMWATAFIKGLFVTSSTREKVKNEVRDEIKHTHAVLETLSSSDVSDEEGRPSLETLSRRVDTMKKITRAAGMDPEMSKGLMELDRTIADRIIDQGDVVRLSRKDRD